MSSGCGPTDSHQGLHEHERHGNVPRRGGGHEVGDQQEAGEQDQVRLQVRQELSDSKI